MWWFARLRIGGEDLRRPVRGPVMELASQQHAEVLWLQPQSEFGRAGGRPAAVLVCRIYLSAADVIDAPLVVRFDLVRGGGVRRLVIMRFFAAEIADPQFVGLMQR